MTTEDVKQELDRRPYQPLRLHLSSGQKIDLLHENMGWVQQNTLLIVHPLQPGTSAIGKYDVIALRLVERIEQINGSARQRRQKKRRT